MRRFTLHLMIALLTFMIGIAAASLWFMLRRPSPMTTNLAENISPNEAFAKPKREYEMGKAGRGMPRDGVSTAFSDWRTSDGISFSRWSEYHDSPESANRELQDTLKKAVKIIKREPLFDLHGRQVGEKVIAIFPSVYSRCGAATLLWIEGSTFRYVRGSSLENIFAIETDFNSQLR